MFCRDLRYVDKAFYSVFNLDKCPEIDQLRCNAINYLPDLIAGFNILPWIRLELF